MVKLALRRSHRIPIFGKRFRTQIRDAQTFVLPCMNFLHVLTTFYKWNHTNYRSMKKSILNFSNRHISIPAIFILNTRVTIFDSFKDDESGRLTTFLKPLNNNCVKSVYYTKERFVKNQYYIFTHRTVFLLQKKN